MKTLILDEVLSWKPTQPLYHYTGQVGFIGIIDQSEILATHTQYLNDRREYLHAIDLVRERIDAHSVSASEEDRQILSEMASALNGIESVNVCVCSFSEERDSLSQWRAYGSATSGFSIGFPGEFLSEVAAKEEWYLAPCIYDAHLQHKVCDALVQELLDQNRRRKKLEESDDDNFPVGGNLIAYLHRLHHCWRTALYRDEKEWRLISRPLSCRNKRFNYRVGRSMLTPYYKFPLVDHDGHFRLHEVIVGPTPHPEQAEMSARSFLFKSFLREVPVESSRVPFRSW